MNRILTWLFASLAVIHYFFEFLEDLLIIRECIKFTSYIPTFDSVRTKRSYDNHMLGGIPWINENTKTIQRGFMIIFSNENVFYLSVMLGWAMLKQMLRLSLQYKKHKSGLFVMLIHSYMGIFHLSKRVNKLDVIDTLKHMLCFDNNTFEEFSAKLLVQAYATVFIFVIFHVLFWIFGDSETNTGQIMKDTSHIPVDETKKTQ